MLNLSHVTILPLVHVGLEKTLFCGIKQTSKVKYKTLETLDTNTCNTHNDLLIIEKYIYYRRVPIVATLVTFGISSLWGSLLSGVVTIGEQKSFTNKASASFFPKITNEQHKRG